MSGRSNQPGALRLLGLLGLVGSFAVPPARAQTLPAVYQGYATDDAGVPLTGEFTLFFRIYPSATGGTPSGTTMVPDVSIDEGSFTVEIPMDPATFATGDHWLAVSVGTAGNELSPRHHVASLPFALRGGGTAMVAGQGPGTLQPAISGCAPGSAIRVVNADGTVECEPDAGEGGAVSDITPGGGLLGNGFTGDVILDLVAGVGLQIDAFGAVEMILGSGAATTVSRSDHDHAGQYWPAGTMVSCFPGFVTGIDSLGNVACDVDRQTSYGVQLGGNLTLDGVNTFHLNGPVDIPGRIAAAQFWPSTGPWVNWLSLHPTDFRPRSLPGDYTADSDGPGRQISIGFEEVYAPLHLPHGANVFELVIVVAKPGAEGDSIFCSIYQNDLSGGGATGLGETGCYGGDFCFLPPSYLSTGTSFIVDNSLYAYTAACEMSTNTMFGSVELYSYRLSYQYNEVLP